MLVPDGALSDDSWLQLQGRQLGHTFDPQRKRVTTNPGIADTRLGQQCFMESSCVVGVLRHTVRVVKALDRAQHAAALAGERLYLSVAADRTDSTAGNLQLPLHMFYKFLAVASLTTTKYLSGVVPLFYGMEVLLEDRQCVELGIVRGCRCVVRDILFDDTEPSHDDDPRDEPSVLRCVPFGLIVQVPAITPRPCFAPTR